MVNIDCLSGHDHESGWKAYVLTYRHVTGVTCTANLVVKNSRKCGIPTLIEKGLPVLASAVCLFSKEALRMQTAPR